jgi:hypothetical protein
MAFSFYMKKSWIDTEPDIELVNIHYSWTPVGEMPSWQSHRETRAMPRGGTLIRGLGGTTIDESGGYTQTQSETIDLPDDGIRRKVLRMPHTLTDPATGEQKDEYWFHHYFEIFKHGRRELSPLYTEEIVSKEVEYLDHDGILGGMCIFWSIYDWDVPQYQPTEEHNFVATYGEDSPFRSHKFYGAEDKENFSRIRSEMLRALPLPRRFVGKIRGPRGAKVVQRWHVGNLWQPNPADRWEDYWGYVEHTL